MMERSVDDKMTVFAKILSFRWDMVFLVVIVSAIGFALMYSAANGNFDKWAYPQIKRFCVFFIALLVIPLISIRLLLRYSYLIYVATLLLLVGVEFFGQVQMGAKRWISIGGFNIQPSELMKIALVFALARYFHGLHHKDITNILPFIPPVLFILIPFVLVLRQPDLGTAVIILMVGGVTFFVAGLSMWVFAVIGVSGLMAIPVIWHFMHDYQKQRVKTFLNPEDDPLGAGYNIIQSQIAIGSGGFSGKGYMSGSQNQLSFLPEKHTDFIFTMLSEEFGFVGSVTVIVLYALIILQGIVIALSSSSTYGRLLAMGIISIFSLHVFINMAMVMGLIPIVGAPLPLLSYGGTMMMTILIGFGIILNVYLNRNRQLHYTIKDFV